MKYLFTILFSFLFQFSSFSQECSYNQKYAGVKMADQAFTFTLIKPVEVSDCLNFYYLGNSLPEEYDGTVGALAAYGAANCENNSLAYDEWVEIDGQFLDFGFLTGGKVYNDVETAAIRANPGNPIFELTGSFPTIVSVPADEEDNVELMKSNYSNVNEVVSAMTNLYQNTDSKNSISFRHFEFFTEGTNENVLITWVNGTGSSASSEDLLDEPTDMTSNEFDITINTTHSVQKNFDWYNDGGAADDFQVSQDGLTIQGSFFITHEMFHAVGLGHIDGNQVNDNNLNIKPIMYQDLGSSGMSDLTAINTGYDENDPCVINAVKCLHDDAIGTCDNLMGSSTITLNIANNNSGDDSSVVLEWEYNVFDENVMGYNILKKDGSTVSSLNSKLITPLAANDKHTFSLPKEYSEQEGFILEAVTTSGMNSFYNF